MCNTKNWCKVTLHFQKLNWNKVTFWLWLNCRFIEIVILKINIQFNKDLESFRVCVCVCATINWNSVVPYLLSQSFLSTPFILLRKIASNTEKTLKLTKVLIKKKKNILQRTNELGSEVSEKLENIDTHSDSVTFSFRNTRN